MKNVTRFKLTEVLAITGGLASFLSLTFALTRWLGISLELTISLLSVIVSFVAGIYSMTLAKAARKLPRSRRVFLAHSRESAPIANLIAQKLRDAGAKVWLDTEQLQPGELIAPAIENAISEADTFIILLSQSQSPNLSSELRIATEQGKRIIPVVLEDAELPHDLQKLRYIDLRVGKEEGIQELIDASS